MKTPPPCMPNGAPCKAHTMTCKSDCVHWAEWLEIHARECEEERKARQAYASATGFLAESGKRRRNKKIKEL